MKGTKGLWLKDYKQSKFILWALWLVSLYIPIKVVNEIQHLNVAIQFWKESGERNPFEYHLYWNNTDVAFLQILVVLILACTLIGLERTNQSMDLTLSLPFKRQTIMLTKWLLGVINIIGATIVSIVAAVILLSNSLLIDYMDSGILWYYGLVSIFVLIGVYTFALLIGFMGASVISQFVFSVIFLLFPMGMAMLIDEFFNYHWEALGLGHFYLPNVIYSLFEHISFPIQLLLLDHRINGFLHGYVNGPNQLGLEPLIVPVIVTIVGLGLIMYFSKAMKSENNGKILVYEKFQPVLKVGVFVCFYLLGGAIFPSFIYNYNESPHVITYHIGGLLLALIVSFIVSKLLGTRFLLGKRS
ncbi:ABC-2 transporter permease [Bacillus luteolus]|uniref:ABC-2 transporter permease n=1 Tax=Litchfieldia luteola TaxID=682179 RepID=A0ABR9QMD2_9BACI|nr:ABC-2 transporter permease [Cytobacillus luteolus]MBE4909609.1 ABC-2 transporter permease [Cytobacillus luteolus]MBP1941010.1 ABC-type transport system involved in multi-copper enzyme maturation permease subunit [Cytobacillus luteolus]